MIFENLSGYRIILASQSPRRQELLKNLGIEFEIFVKDDIDESYPEDLNKHEIVEFLAKHKASSYIHDMTETDLLITADTIVWYDGNVLGKPLDYDHAFAMLRSLAGNTHTVLTGVCLKSLSKEVVFSSTTDVTFRKLTDREIDYYLQNYRPYDKAGAYGIQEWIGYAGVESISGSYFNVMGLPVQRVYDELVWF